jgi:hypothetical protein
MDEETITPPPASPSKKSSPQVPWYESNILWSGGVGVLLLVLSAAGHHKCWLLWFSWLCFVYTVRSALGNRYQGIRRWGYTLIGAVLLGAALYGVKMSRCPVATMTISNPVPPPPPGNVTVTGDCNAANTGNGNHIQTNCSDGKSSNDKNTKE